VESIQTKLSDFVQWGSIDSVPITLVGAGLPQVAGQLGEAKSYAERLFEFGSIGLLPEDAARSAVVGPIESVGATIESSAVE
jgi:hypothetical protein